MADDGWWDRLLAIMFGTPATGGIGVANSGLPAARSAGKSIDAELQREQAAGLGQAPPQQTPVPQVATTTATTTANPNAAQKDDFQTQLEARLAATGAGATTNPLYGGLPNANVFMGRTVTQRGPGRQYDAGYVQKDTLVSVQEAVAQLNEWGIKKRAKFAELAVAAGYLPTVTTDYDKLEPILTGMAVRSAKLYDRGIRITPWSLLEGSATGDPASAGPKTTTSTSTVSDLTDPKDAAMLVDQLLSERLGRAASDKEKQAFLAALNSYEKKHPKTTTTTTTTSADGSTSNSKTTSKGGVNPTSFGKDWTLGHNKDEAGSFQALSTYMPAFFEALGAPV
jgi:hypothetical protein